MKIYIVERDNPYCTPKPEVFTNPIEAERKVRKEYETQMIELGTSQEISDAGDGGYGCTYSINDCLGECLISSDADSDIWKWRITENEIENVVDADKLINCFKGMAKRETLLTGKATQDDLLIQIIGAIVHVKMEE